MQSWLYGKSVLYSVKRWKKDHVVVFIDADEQRLREEEEVMGSGGGQNQSSNLGKCVYVRVSLALVSK